MEGIQLVLGDSPVVDDEVCERELVGVEEERGNAKRKDGYPEVYQVWSPKRESHVEQHQQCPHTEVDTRAGKAREKNAK